MRKELLTHLFGNPELLDEVDLEWIPDGTDDGEFIRGIIEVMMDLRRQGLVPTPRNIAESDTDSPDELYGRIKEVLSGGESTLGPSFIIATLREEFADNLLGKIALNIERNRRDQMPSNDILEAIQLQIKKMPVPNVKVRTTINHSKVSLLSVTSKM